MPSVRVILEEGADRLCWIELLRTLIDDYNIRPKGRDGSLILSEGIPLEEDGNIRPTFLLRLSAMPGVDEVEVIKRNEGVNVLSCAAT